MPIAESLTTYPVDADYVVCTPQGLLVDGVTLPMGATLPADNALRQMPRRIEQLCDQRKLEIRRGASKATAAPAPASDLTPNVYRTLKEHPEAVDRGEEKPKAKTRASIPNLDALTHAELKHKCKQFGLTTNGTKNDLRDRLRAKLG